MEDLYCSMLHREAELRKAPETLKRMEISEGRKGDWVDVVEKIQQQVLDEFQGQGKSNRILHIIPSRSLNTTSGITLTGLRQAALRHPEIAFWVRYNRARRGNLRVGDTAPNVALVRAIDGTTPIKLFGEDDAGGGAGGGTNSGGEGGGEGRRTVIVAGSLS